MFYEPPMKGKEKMTFIQELNLRNEGVSQLRAMGINDKALKEEAEIMDITAGLQEHPDDYDGSCSCKECMSYAD
jgi:hypothetical protein